MSEFNFSLINFDALAPIGVRLLDVIKDAGIGIGKPRQIKRVAKAEAEASIIKAKADAEVLLIQAQGEIGARELQERALNRFITEETRKQENMENIVRKALPDLNEDAKPEDMDKDWVTNFFDKCRIVSDEEMQSLWARILAGEANKPGAFSKRTVSFVADMDKRDAELFTTLCSYSIKDRTNFQPCVYSYMDHIYAKNRLNYETLSILDSIGLIRFDPTNSIFMAYPTSIQLCPVSYFDNSLSLAMPKGRGLCIGLVIFTALGKELAPIAGSKPIEGFWEYLLNKWREAGYLPAVPPPAQPTN